MAEAVTLDEAKLFLRVAHAGEDAVVATLVAAAQERIETALGLALTPASPASLRVAVLQLAAHAYERGAEPAGALVEPWIAAFRKARL